ncbi:hypothetical protein AGABI2DRAFT_119954 [Agaricus bisporus var. bisporus H97]|uniref:hypothetical protein n=1 Tax=Agaricus bisporus var. bisporus (strain H97 / ATCC MYA-4626 / FGSC 10389) TaxID=936046 RepID=UPI00029F6FA8|nr:hypothetical protein AGABI2DRAFT_119954 [Agaricus bisporus var. bisporus H97]EKV44981.1 hypothetical protein AGABI2DRAFT_119954 [Agaricus bisporus var. bisporus H97]
MPAFSFHRPRFLRSRRSRSQSPKPSPLDPHDGAAIAHSTVPGKDTNATATGASHPSVPGNPIDHQNSTDRPVGDRASEYSNASAQRQPSQVSRPVTPSGFVPPYATETPEPHGPGVQQPTFLASSNYYTDSVQGQKLLEPLSPLAAPSQQPLDSDPLLYLSKPQHQNPAMFSHAQNFTVTGGNFIAGNVIHNDLRSDHFMRDLLEETIPGAEFDSSARDPPPRCHPGTRLAILDRCLYFIRTCDSIRKMRWVVGAAGVGKSALLQSVVESPKLVASCHASVFFSINGRDNGTKAIVTISYQLAAKCKPYRQLIEREIIDDPSLLQSSMAKQFFKFIVEPFIHNPQLNSVGHVLVVIDGLDECKHPRTQLELLRLISDFCITNPSSPLVWLIASRPEQHITSFFSRSDVAPAYEKEEIMADSDEARADVERFLRDEFTEIRRKASDSVDPRWPQEQDLWKLSNAAGGLFAYAQTVVRYIDDATAGSPASQLSEVLNVIDNHPTTDMPQEDHPMASLDALYARILSNVPSKVMMNTRKLLLALAFDWVGSGPSNFVILCNWLGMTPDDAYAALKHLRSVLHVPTRGEAHEENLIVFHKSFMDYISDFRRSGYFHDIKREARQLLVRCVFRILDEAPDGVDFADGYYDTFYGTLRRGPDTGVKISVIWPLVNFTDDTPRLIMYEAAIEEVAAGMKRRVPTFQNEFCIRILSTWFEEYRDNFPFSSLRNLVFDESRRQEFVKHGILKQLPLKAVDVSPVIYKEAKLQFRRFATTTNLSDPWKPSCPHEREGMWEGGTDRDWTTVFRLRDCDFCMERLEHQLKDWKTRLPDHVVPALFTSTGDCCVEFQFVDPEDGISEWTYWWWVKVSLEERKKYGSDV